MIFVFGKDATLEIMENLAETQKNCEGIDVENGEYLFFDEHGRALEPQFITPNKTEKFLWFFNFVINGTYELNPNPVAQTDRLRLALNEIVLLEPNKWFQDLNEVKDYFRVRNIQIDSPSQIEETP